MINEKLIEEAIERDFKDYMRRNEEMLQRWWINHLSEMEDSAEFIRKLSQSDKSFEEFARQIYDDREPRDEY